MAADPVVDDGPRARVRHRHHNNEFVVDAGEYLINGDDDGGSMFARLLVRAAPRATSQGAPRRGSGNAVIHGVVPVAFLVVDGVDSRVGASDIAFGAEDRLVLGT
jgi:hypothetical protein